MSLPELISVKNELITVIDWLRFAATQFQQSTLYYGHGTDNAWDDAAALVVDSLKLPHDQVNIYLSAALTMAERAQLFEAIDKRISKRIPVPYLTKRAWFMGLPFYVDERVLIPRSPMAELITQQLEPWIIPEQATDILELCTGSGCIAVALAKSFPWAKIHATDIDTDALAVAKKNVADYGLDAQISLHQGDLFASIPKEKQFQVIISNPPYVPEADVSTLPQEYHHEPKRALAAGVDGLDCVRRILREASDYLTDDGILMVEVGVAEEALAAAYPKVPFTWLSFEHGGEGVFLLTAAELKAHGWA